MLFINCKKNGTNTNTNSIQSILNTFPNVYGNQYWKIYYSAVFQTTDTTEIQECVDSLYISSDSIGLNIISNNSGITDTSLIQYNIIKMYRKFEKFGQSNWQINSGQNFGIYRVDTISNKIYSVNTSCYCWPGGL